ncbi:hypothetical protein K2173_003043 [Erythroxylum novogranatense]|uniref:Reverse transcriptase Ty1/copia-type domain-containing protein n=1 Tax=Erythroxylum novogranatense TaxID=1862640 RepID=A0AAV8S887_9ROSI|nr:hypothetical protein K2173_003043 [Erythroxylum novogranatense]
MDSKLDTLEANGTWELTRLPAGKKAISSKWVYKVKLKPNGEVDRFKARLVAKGYNQIEGEIQKVKAFLDDVFTIKDLQHAKYFLDLEIARSSRGIYINQRKYVLDLVADAGLMAATDGLPLEDPQPYRQLVGKLLYLGYTQPDITFVVHQLSQFVHAPTVTHWQAAQHVLRPLLKSNTIPVVSPVSLKCDNQAAFHITVNPVFHERTKHLDIDCHIVRD